MLSRRRNLSVGKNWVTELDDMLSEEMEIYNDFTDNEDEELIDPIFERMRDILRNIKEDALDDDVVYEKLEDISKMIKTRVVIANRRNVLLKFGKLLQKLG